MSEKPSDLIFSLDIGTRSVVGVLLKQQEDVFAVIDFEIAEHDERSMLDGQIHDVLEVSQVIRTVKSRLEDRNGPLKQVSVAAAGRSLKTIRLSLEHATPGKSLLNKDDVLSLELSAIQEAQKQLAEHHSETEFHHYYCVGYSVINYYLDGEMIGNLIDQRGSIANVEIIATFLPRIVVDSLMTALKRADLQMNTLTLEPIAAINILIPSSMRKLNIALVDIGAGTSDIALTAEGTITAYGMVPVAGDEITEALSQAYLLDFQDAEHIKRQLQTDQPVTFTDILGMEYTSSVEEMVKRISPDIEHLAEKISHKIFELNGSSPQAVMLIGGGSLTPTLPEVLAQKLQLPATRVAVRGADAIKNLVLNDSLKGPEFVTPIGIAVAAQSHPIKYLTVSLNDEEVRIFDLKKIQVGDVMLHAGINIKKLYGKPGMAISVHVNGKLKFLPGTLGEAPHIMVNGLPAHFDTVVKNNDVITVEAGRDGTSPDVLVRDLIEDIGTLDVYINEQLYSLPPLFERNEQPCEMTEKIQDRDRIQIRLPRTVQEIIIAARRTNLLETVKLSYTLNQRGKTAILRKAKLYVNDKEASLISSVSQNDRITVEEISMMEKPTLSSLLSEEELVSLSMNVTFNGMPLQLPIIKTELFVNGNPAVPEQLIEDGDSIEFKASPPVTPIFSDVFRYIDIDLGKPGPSTQMKTCINGEPAHFHSELKEGDQLELIWE
ncbi:cell division protein FtsA [Ammoniphilus resinae]|uniref:Cell division protein FtsA n=1 Tax=Ammoniphilus resinae TaxID=861532 RepID=A0ABS4GRQ4_9BACL|nr:cell division protein FtsA [Ammoniphilus resinae]